MCEVPGYENESRTEIRNLPITDAVGMVLAHDVTEIRQGEFKGRAFRKGHMVTKEDICHLQRLGKDHLFVLEISEDEVHEDEAAYALAISLKGEGVALEGEPKEGKINLIAQRDGLLKIEEEALLQFNMLGDVMCATLHSNTVVRKGQVVAGTRAIPLVVKKKLIEEAVTIAEKVRTSPSHSPLTKEGHGLVKAGAGERERITGLIEVKEFRKPRAGIVITGNEVYYDRIKDAFAPIITEKIKIFGGEVVGIYYAPDDEAFIEARMRELIEAGADLLITTGGMSVDPDDVTRFAIRNLGATDITYGSAALPGAMFLAAYIEKVQSERGAEPTIQNPELIPILGIPACGMYHKTTSFDLVLPRILTGEKIGRRELAELGHGGLCLNCRECRYPVCPFGK